MNRTEIQDGKIYFTWKLFVEFCWWYPTTTLHGVTTQKNSTWIFTAVNTSYLSTQCQYCILRRGIDIKISKIKIFSLGFIQRRNVSCSTYSAYGTINMYIPWIHSILQLCYLPVVGISTAPVSCDQEQSGPSFENLTSSYRSLIPTLWII